MNNVMLLKNTADGKSP